MTFRDGKMTDTATTIVVVLVIFAVGLAAALGATIGAEKGVYFFQRERDCSGAPFR